MFLLLFFLMMMRMTEKIFVMMFLPPLLLMTILMKMTGRNSIKNTREVRVVFALNPSLECWNYLTIVLISYRIIKQWELFSPVWSGSYLWCIMTDCPITTSPGSPRLYSLSLLSPLSTKTTTNTRSTLSSLLYPRQHGLRERSYIVIIIIRNFGLKTCILKLYFSIKRASTCFDSFPVTMFYIENGKVRLFIPQRSFCDKIVSDNYPAIPHGVV